MIGRMLRGQPIERITYQLSASVWSTSLHADSQALKMFRGEHASVDGQIFSYHYSLTTQDNKYVSSSQLDETSQATQRRIKVWKMQIAYANLQEGLDIHRIWYAQVVPTPIESHTGPGVTQQCFLNGLGFPVNTYCKGQRRDSAGEGVFHQA